MVKKINIELGKQFKINVYLCKFKQYLLKLVTQPLEGVDISHTHVMSFACLQATPTEMENQNH